MSYSTCPNCGTTLQSAWAAGSPSSCPDCCARLQVDVALGAAVAERAPAKPSFDAILLTGRDAPALARHELAMFAAPLGDEVVSTAGLLLSEIVTNAVLHGPAEKVSTIEVRGAITGERLRVEVTDDGGGFVPPNGNGNGNGSGWGLRLIDSLAEDWGVAPGPPTRVWFALDL